MRYERAKGLIDQTRPTRLFLTPRSCSELASEVAVTKAAGLFEGAQLAGFVLTRLHEVPLGVTEGHQDFMVVVDALGRETLRPVPAEDVSVSCAVRDHLRCTGGPCQCECHTRPAEKVAPLSYCQVCGRPIPARLRFRRWCSEACHRDTEPGAYDE